MMTITKTIYKNFFSLSIAELFGKVIAFFSLIYLARALGVNGFGKISFSMAIAEYALLLSNLGLDTYGSREVSRNRESGSARIVNNIMGMELVAASVSFLALLLFVLLMPKPAEIKMITVILGLNVFSFAFTIGWFFLGIEKMEFITIAKIVRSITYFILIIALIKGPQNILYFPIIDVITKAILATVLILFYMKIKGALCPKFDFSFWKEIFPKALPLGIAAIMATIYCNLDSIMLGFMKGDTVVGLYNASYKVIDSIIIMPTLIVQTLFPVLASGFLNKDRMEHNSKKFIRLMFNLGIPVGFGGILFASDAIRLFFGKAYQGSVLPLQILCWNATLIFMNTSFNRNLIALNREKVVMKLIGLGAIVNIILNILLIPKFSLIGAAIATILAELLVLLFSYIKFNENVSINFLTIFLKPIYGSIAVSLIVLVLSFVCKSIFVLVPAFIALYFIFLHITKEMDCFLGWK